MFLAHRSKIFIAFALAVVLIAGAITPTRAQVLKPANYAEHIFIHTDKQTYLAGEILWFRPYLLQTSRNKNNQASSIIYTELLDPKGVSILKSKTSTKKEFGSGSFFIPATTPTGAYTLIAYTQQMLNGDTRFFYKKKINIINTLIENSQAKGAAPAAFIDIFPEGGRLVEGIQNTVGIRVSDPVSGKGVNVKGVIITENKDTVAHFITQKFGLGQFSFTPAPGEKYNAIIDNHGKRAIANIAPADPNGYNMHVTEKNNSYQILINNRNKSGSMIYLSAHDGQTSSFSTKLSIGTSPVELSVEKSKLKRGINYFTVFDQNHAPLMERLVFIPHKSDESAIQIQIDSDVLGTRQQASLKLRPGSGAEIAAPVQASLSVAALQNNDEEVPIGLYTTLTRHLYGVIEQPSFYITPAASSVDLDNLMLTHGWRTFEINSNNSRPVIPEYDGHIITAKVFDKWNKSVAPNVSCLLSVPSIPFGLYYGVSDSNGIVRFNVNDYFGPGDIFIKAIPTATNVKPDNIIQVIDAFADSAAKQVTQPALFLNPSDSTWLLQRSIAMQASNIYHKDNLNKFIIPAIDSLPFYGKPEYRYLLDDYKRFSTMEEVLREYVTPINVVLKNGNLNMRIYDEKYETVYNDGILVLLDGVPLFDYNTIFSYNPYKVKRLDIVPRRYIIGPFSFAGIASFETYNARFGGFELDPDATPVDYEGLQLQRSFYMPEYQQNKGDIRKPDFRSTLLWNPALLLQNGAATSVNISTSDLKGKYRITVHGLSENGVSFYGQQIIEVK
ncbi:hypothetical protein ABDK00_010145 [Niabella insulamsoli]|uniref:hypothetical protein n=1 Tax=Niabella insulamsoli TaxID=3144874 RepID=UPI0031FC0783